MLARGTQAVNGVVDRAGRYRRFAAGFALLAFPAAAMGFSLWIVGGFSIFAICHLVVSASLIWLAADLIRWASLVDTKGIPHASLGAVLASMVVLRISAPQWVSGDLGSRSLVALSLIGLCSAMIVLAIADRKSSTTAALAGRALLVFSGLIFGVAQLTRMVNGVADYTAYSVGLGFVGLVVLATVHFEGRLLWRSIQWIVPQADQ